jgi:7-cyano-7-deazaguanine synthase in queuosine biosynthesis
MAPFAVADVAARDLARIAVSAFIADTAMARPTVTLHRNIQLYVHIESAASWTQAATQAIVDLLHWLTGDTWQLRLIQAAPVKSVAPSADLPGIDRVQLLSGGLDSLCGAIVACRDATTSTLFLGHSDTSKAIKHAQRIIGEQLDEGAHYRRFAIHPQGDHSRLNHGPRSRSLMFMALGICAASAVGATEVVVPENGFTSINPPLDPSRGGTLTTRSTHPWTFDRLNRLLHLLNLDGISAHNPYALLTKGQLVARALPDVESQSRWRTAVTTSLSCAKLDTHYFSGGNPNLNCGLCVACVVRRAAFRGAKLVDSTEYAVDKLKGKAREDLIYARREDIVSLRWATRRGVDEDAVLASAMWPPRTDFDEMLDICRRGLEELALVRLPT